MSDKEKLAKELDRILQVKDINWGLLPKSDLVRLFEASGFGVQVSGRSAATLR